MDNVTMYNARGALYWIVNSNTKLTQGIACTRSMFAQARERFGYDVNVLKEWYYVSGRAGGCIRNTIVFSRILQ